MFWKRRKAKKENLVREKVATGIAYCIMRAQLGFAKYMNRRTSSLTTRGKKWFLFFVCIVLGGMSLVVLVNVFVPSKEPPSISKPHAIQVPAHITEDSLDKKLNLKR